MKVVNVLVIASLCAACGGGSTAEQTAAGAAETAVAGATGSVPAVVETAAAPARLAFREVTLPAGTTLRLELKSAIGSDSSAVEDAVRAELRRAVSVEGQPVLPAGTEVVGTVTDVARSGRVKGRARIAYRFDSLRHEGERYDIRTAPLSHTAAATKGEDATKIAIGAGAGAALGAMLGGGDGAAKGAAIGGAAGTGTVLATRGKEVRLGPGADITTKLTAPLTLRVKM